MRRVSSRLLVGFLSVMAVLIAMAPSASASNIQVGTGTVQLGPPTLVWEKMVGDYLIRAEDGSLTFTGTIAGTGTLHVLALVRPDGSEVFIGSWAAPVTVNGISGTLELAVRGSDNGVFSGTFFAHGTGGLAGLVGVGQFSGQDATGAGTYTFHYILPGSRCGVGGGGGQDSQGGSQGSQGSQWGGQDSQN
jgi:hypothetical protein